MLAQFEPMFEFGPLDHNTANPVRVPGNIRVNLCFHSSLSVVQPKYRTRIGFVCTRRFPTLPADKSNGNSLSDRSVCSSNPTFCNGRIVLSSYQNNFGVGSNKCALRASNSFSNRRDSSKISGFRKVKYRRCVCRTCATNRTYSAACSGVIFSKFSICGHFVPSWYNLSIFLFACLYGLLFGLCGDGRFSGPSTLGFRVQDFPNRIRDGFGTGVAPKEHPGSGPVILFARPATRGINRYVFSERTRAGYGRKNLGRHYSNSTIETDAPISWTTLIAASAAFSRLENNALCFWDDAQ